MLGTVLAGAFLAVIGFFLWVLPPVARSARDAPGAEVVAASMLVYQKAAVDWCLNTGCAATGQTIPDAQLSLAPADAMPPWLHTQTDGRRVWTYADPPGLDVGAVAAILSDLTRGGPAAGVTCLNAGRVVLSARAAVPAEPTFPAGVPVPVPIIIQAVRWPQTPYFRARRFWRIVRSLCRPP